jgi:hypothetical protein
MRARRGLIWALPVVLAIVVGASQLPASGLSAQGKSAPAASSFTSPEKFFGFQLGADRKIARWDRIVEYYKQLEKESPKLKVVDMGPSTMGNPFLALYISSPANLAKLEQLRQINAKISDPRGATEAEIKKLVADGKAVIIQSMSLHATEIGGAQMAPELVYDLLSRTDEETQRILDNVVSIMVPSFNPDGQIMVTDYYNKTLGTEYEGSGLPWLYHKYTGHDNNRDAFMANMIESQYMAKVMFREWIPQAYVDHHHMGSYGARIYVPPYAEPVRPGADPLIWREHSWYGAHIAYKEEEAGKSGIINMSQYSGWGHFGFHWITPFHNIAGMLTESASARLATPLFIHPDQLRGGTRGMPSYAEQTTFPNPWPGGWWRLRDIVERQKISAWATLDLAARNKETVLWNAYLKAKRQTERGAAGKPAAFVIPAAQHDPLTAIKMVTKLLVQGVEVHQVKSAFSVDGVGYAAGSFVVSMAQPKMGLIRYLLGRTFYPDNEWTRDREGSPTRPYDMATDTMFEFMGVRVDPVNEAVKGDLQKLAAAVTVAGKVGTGGGAYVMDGRLNDSFRAVNMLVDKGVAVKRVDAPADATVRPGDFVVSAGSEAVLADVAKATGVDFTAIKAAPAQGAHDVKRMRIGMYQRYGGGNMDEGWTRWLLEQWGYPYTSIMDAEVKKGGLEAKYDVIIIPDDSTTQITGERPPAGAGGPGGGFGFAPESVPPEYRSGMGREGVDALKAFVQKGGTLVTLGNATAFAIDRFALPVRNVLAGRPSKDFFCPGSTLHAIFDNKNPLAYGMPSEGLVLFWSNQAFEIAPNEANESYEVVVRYPRRDLLQSGWLIGEDLLFGKAAMVSAKVGSGKVVLIGLRPQARATTHATFKLLFNALTK